jgi:HAE1 family hydrophobic/amphiphilic exporter-1
MPGRASLSVVQDGTRPIAANLNDVKESIFFAILLTVAVVFLFLRNWRSTAITALAIPNSLLGATALMYFAGFTLNLMSLLALSLSVGLLVDDAIVVRENIYRRMQNGEPPERAALEGTNEVRLAVIATSLTVAAVFLPIAFMKGLVGQYFKEFGLTVCFVLLISTFDSLTIAPMLSAYFGRRAEKADRDKKSGSGAPEKLYRKLLCFCLRRPVAVLGLAAAVFAASVWTAASIPAVFLPPAENGEFYVNFEGPAELNLAGMSARALEADETLRKNPLVANTLLQTGARDGESNKASIFVELKPAKKRKISTSQAQEILRRELRKFAPLNPVISDSGQNEAERAVTINITGEDLPALRAFAAKFYERFKHHPAITDPDLSEKPGKPESRVILDSEKAARTGLSPATAGEELRVQLEGTKVGLLRENGREYDIRVKMAGPDRDLAKNFNEILAPNINGRLIKLSRAAKLTESRAPQSVNRVNRARYITFAAGLMPNGPGLQAFMNDMNSALSSELKPPPGIKITAAGDAENYAELLGSVTVALLLGICFIYLVLASLYESFTAPLAILLALPLAASGALFALKAGGLSINVYSIIGCILLLGVAAKNSILLVDRIRFNLMAGTTLAAAVLRAGRLRLRPILMTSCALVAGMLPVAARLNEASAQRVSMGWAVIGGILSSTLMSLFVVPAAYALVYALHKRRAKKTDAKQLLNQTTQQEAK